MLLRLSIALAAFAVVGTPLGHARAAPPPRVAITSTTLMMQGDLKPSVRSVYRRLEQGLARSGLSVLSAERVLKALSNHPSLQGCETPACLIHIGTILRAAFCAQAKAIGDRRETRIKVVITWSHSGLVAVRAQRRCRDCTTARFEKELGLLAAEAGRKALQAYRLTPPPPRRRATPRRSNGKPGGKPSGRPYWIAGLALLGAGVAGLVPGGVLWGLHGRKTTRGCAPLYDRCEMDTRAGGIAATALGSAAAITGIALLLYQMVQGRQPKVVITVDPARLSLVLTGRF